MLDEKIKDTDIDQIIEDASNAMNECEVEPDGSFSPIKWMNGLSDLEEALGTMTDAHLPEINQTVPGADMTLAQLKDKISKIDPDGRECPYTSDDGSKLFIKTHGKVRPATRKDIGKMSDTVFNACHLICRSVD